MQQYPVNLDALSKHLQDNERRQGDDITWWTIPRGTSSIRILPPWDATGSIALQVFQHRIEYKDDSMSYTKYNWTCSEKSFGVSCPICQALQEMASVGINVAEYEANRRVFYVNLMVMYDVEYENAVRSGKKPEGGLPMGSIAVSRIPKTIYDWVVTQITNPLIGNLTDLETGIDLYVTKEGQGLGTSYSVTTSPNGRSPVPKEFIEGKSLYDLTQIFSQGHDEKLLSGMLHKIKSSATYMQGITQVPPQIPNYANPTQYTAPNPMMNQAPTPMAPPPQFAVPNPVHTTPAPIPPAPVVTSAPPQPVAPPPEMQAAPVTQAPPQQIQMPLVPTSAAVAPPLVAPAPPQTLQQAHDANHPKCFGNYNPADVTCVVCPSEIECTKVSQK